MLGVLIFHLFPHAMTGGFVGVDVFFVISGYLITRILRRQTRDGSFRFRDFMLRRLRRLSLPLVAVVVTTWCVGLTVLLPENMAGLSESVLSQPVALQNVYFLVDGDYFRRAAHKPLLHTWSLGVEEQFYLLWPWLLVLLRRRRGWPELLALMALSFGLNLMLMPLSPKASFFLLPSRAWELGAGGLVALLEESARYREAMRRAALPLGVVGAACTGASLMLIDESMGFPGFVALAPVLGTTLLIAHGAHEGSPVRRALSWRPLVGIGLVSYSLYLWHWPVIVFARRRGLYDGELAVALLLALVSVGLAVGTYYGLETPVRRRRFLSTGRSLLVAVLASFALVALLGLVGVRSQGAAFRYEGVARQLLTAPFDAADDKRCGFLFRVLHPRAQVCQLSHGQGERRVLLWGNSHADMWSHTLVELGREAHFDVFLNARNCRPTKDSAFCGGRVQEPILQAIEREGIEDVVLAATWYGAYDRPDEELEAELEDVVAAIQARGSRVWLLVDVPSDPQFDPERRYREAAGDLEFHVKERAAHDVVRHRERALFEGIARRIPDVYVLDPTDTLCPEAQGGGCPGGLGETAWYRDTNHLTHAGARRAASTFARLVSASAGRR